MLRQCYNKEGVMARKISITPEIIKNAGFALAREKGLEAVTARRLADQAGCSTQPIFRIYEKMEQLHEDIFLMAADFFSNFYETEKAKNKISDKPFVQFGLLYIRFATEEPQLFRMLFLSGNRYGRSLYELLDGSTGAFTSQMNAAKALGIRNPGELFMNMWIFIHGAACMSITGDYDLSMDETIRLLSETYEKNAPK